MSHDSQRSRTRVTGIGRIVSGGNRGRTPELTFYRDGNGNEVDLILERQRIPVPMEIKSSETWNPRFAKQVAYFRKVVPQSHKGYVIYAGDLTPETEDYTAIHFGDVGKILDTVDDRA